MKPRRLRSRATGSDRRAVAGRGHGRVARSTSAGARTIARRKRREKRSNRRAQSAAVKREASIAVHCGSLLAPCVPATVGAPQMHGAEAVAPDGQTGAVSGHPLEARLRAGVAVRRLSRPGRSPLAAWGVEAAGDARRLAEGAGAEHRAETVVRTRAEPLPGVPPPLSRRASLRTPTPGGAETPSPRRRRSPSSTRLAMPSTTRPSSSPMCCAADSRARRRGGDPAIGAAVAPVSQECGAPGLKTMSRRTPRRSSAER